MLGRQEEAITQICIGVVEIKSNPPQKIEMLDPMMYKVKFSYGEILSLFIKG